MSIYEEFVFFPHCMLPLFSCMTVNYKVSNRIEQNFHIYKYTYLDASEEKAMYEKIFECACELNSN